MDNEDEDEDGKTHLVQRDAVSAVEREIAVLQARFEAHGTSLPLTRRPALDNVVGCAETIHRVPMPCLYAHSAPFYPSAVSYVAAEREYLLATCYGP